MALRLDFRTAVWSGALIASFLFAPGCSTESRRALLEEPKARITSTRLSDIDFERAKLLVGLAVENPLPFDIPLSGIEYEIMTEGRKLLGGKSERRERIRAESESEVTLPVDIVFADLLAALGDVEAGTVIPYTAMLSLGVDVPGAEALRVPIRKEGKLPIPAMPSIDIRDLRLDELSMDAAKLALELEIGNRNQFELGLSSLGYALSLAGFEVGRSTVDEKVNLAPGGSDRVTIHMGFAPKKLGLALFSALLQGKAPYKLEGMAHFDSPFGELDMPFRKEGEAGLRR